MTTKTQFKGVEEILNELKTQAAKGSCKTCQFCIPGGREDYGTTHLCGINRGINVIDFTKSDLSRAAYPYGPCEAGDWTRIDDNGNTTQIPGCLAYKPKVIEGVQYRDEIVKRQIRFMKTLSEAARLYYAVKAVKEGQLDELLQELNGSALATRNDNNHIEA